jgi:hypothetical protein
MADGLGIMVDGASSHTPSPYAIRHEPLAISHQPLAMTVMGMAR